jgi:hypothetical protein
MRGAARMALTLTTQKSAERHLRQAPWGAYWATRPVLVLAMAFGLIIPKLCIDSITGGTLDQG